MTGTLTLAGAPAGDLARLPRRLSPSRAKDFLDCPLRFYERTILGQQSEQTVETVRGTLTHAVLEHTFDAAPQNRSVQASLALIEPMWKMLTSAGDDRAEDYLTAVPAGSQTERQMFAFVAQMVRNWYAMERVTAFSPTGLVLPDGRSLDGREYHVTAPVLTDGASLHGYIDRIDFANLPDGKTMWALSDYKTGSIPGSGKNYPRHVQERILDDAFFALKTYAYLARELLGVTPAMLRLVYLVAGDAAGVKRMPVTDQLLDATGTRMRQVWDDIVAAAAAGAWPCSHSRLCEYRPHQVVEPLAS